MRSSQPVTRAWISTDWNACTAPMPSAKMGTSWRLAWAMLTGTAAVAAGCSVVDDCAVEVLKNPYATRRLIPRTAAPQRIIFGFNRLSIAPSLPLPPGQPRSPRCPPASARGVVPRLHFDKLLLGCNGRPALLNSNLVPNLAPLWRPPPIG